MTKELTKRVITSLVLAIIVLNCLLINNHSWLVLLIVVSLISWLEFFNLTKKIYKKIYPKFNRAVIFDTSRSSWHSVSSIKAKKIRKTIAVYYLISLTKKNSVSRQRALYAPLKKEIHNKKILKFIKMRANSHLFSKVYKTKK